MDKNIDSVYDFLSEEGYRPKRNDDESLVFKHEGDIYYLAFDNNDSDYCSIRKAISIDVNDNDILNIYKIVNKINSEYKLGKCVFYDDDEDRFYILQIDSLGSFINFQKNFDRYLVIIKGMEEDFSREYNKSES